MSNIRITTLGGGTTAVSSSDLEAFAATLDGSVALPDSDGYQAATHIWNGMITRRPALVVRAAGTPDVVRTVDFARNRGLELAIRGGGHNIAGLSLSDGGITLDLSTLRAVDVDAEARLARVAPGCTLGDVDRATQQHGRATTLGFVSETGAAGLTLGGGFGYLTRRYGWTVDDLESVEIVTAEGRVRRASREENADLFWALRGGGGNFGVVTEFVFRLHDVGPAITGGLVAWPASEAEGVLELFRRITESAPRELTLAVLRRNAPPAPWLPASAHGKPMVGVVVCHTGSPEQAAQDLAPLRSFGEPWADLIMRKEYSAQQSMLDATQPKGMAYYWKSEFLPRLGDDVLADYHAQFEGLEAPANQIVLFHIGGRLNELAEDDGAMGNRNARYACVIAAMNPVGAPIGSSNIDWVRSAWTAMKPHGTGGNYVNFQTDDEPADRVAESYGGNLARLAEVKAKYDPGNLFRVNRNIAPAG